MTIDGSLEYRSNEEAKWKLEIGNWKLAILRLHSQARMKLYRRRRLS